MLFAIVPVNILGVNVTGVVPETILPVASNKETVIGVRAVVFLG